MPLRMRLRTSKRLNWLGGYHGWCSTSFVDFSLQLFLVRIQAGELMNDFAFGIQQCDEIGMGKLALRVLFEFHARAQRLDQARYQGCLRGGSNCPAKASARCDNFSEPTGCRACESNETSVNPTLARVSAGSVASNCFNWDTINGQVSWQLAKNMTTTCGRPRSELSWMVLPSSLVQEESSW